MRLLRLNVVRSNWLGVVTLVLVLVLWEVMAQRAESVYFPPISVIAAAFWRDWVFDAALQHGVPSMRRMFIGFAIGATIAVVLGLLMGTNRRVYELFDPVLEFLRAIPSVAIIPVAILVLGLTDVMKVFVIAFGVFFPVLLNTAAGARQVSLNSLETAAIFQLNRFDTLRRVILPASMPMIFAGIRISLAIGLIMVVVSEMIGGTNGIGWYLIYHQRLFDSAEMFSGIILLGILGNVLNSAFVWLESKVLFWHFGSAAGAQT